MKKRLFVAIELPQQLKNKIASYQKDIIKQIQGQPRLTVKENLHITVSFLDTVEDTYIPGLIKEFMSVQKEFIKFPLHYGSTILGPPGRFPSMIWITYDPKIEFTGLIREINGKVVSFLKKHNQPVLLSSHQNPTPHITLARFKNNLTPSQISLTPFTVAELSVQSFTLMHSQLTPKGPTYTALSTFNLK